MPEMTATIPHQLGKSEAKRRIQSHIATLRQQHAALFSNLTEQWTGDTMTFSLTALAQTISGRLVVEEHAVQVAVSLPWIFQALESAIRPQIEDVGRKLLEQK
jgi:hypothetical protein